MTPHLASLILWTMWLISTPMALSMNSSFMIEWSMLHMNSSSLILPIILDQTGLLFCSAVMFISANVMLFAKTYMKSDPFLPRFTYLVLLFVLSMNLLIFIPHMMALLIGWDGLGLVSFLLVIYYQNPKSLGAGMITVLSNRVGDAFLLLSIGWTLNQGHWTITAMWSNPMNSIITLAVVLAAMTKSAQIPFSPWLPAAMAAPTPVSALVHSSTLVTAGVFLLIRFLPFLTKTAWFSSFLLLIASTTMLMAGFSAMMECDMKKIIALSTLSQLGVMMVSLAYGSQSLALFHLLTHAMFKALLFVCAGTMIHTHHHSQDLRLMGSTANQMPITSSCLLIANMSLMGSPFLSGFYSKDMIIEQALFTPSNLITISMLIIATILTTSYSIRFMLAVLWSPLLSQPMGYLNDTDENCSIAMILLSSKAILFGAALNWNLMTPSVITPLNPTWKMMPIWALLFGLFFTWLFQTPNSSTQSSLMKMPLTHFNATSMLQLTPISTQKIILPIMLMSDLTTKQTDNGWLEIMGPQGIQKTTSISSSKMNLLLTLPFSSFLLAISITLMMLYLLS